MMRFCQMDFLDEGKIVALDTPEGLKKGVDVDQTQSIVYKTGQKLNAAVAVLLVLGVLAVLIVRTRRQLGEAVDGAAPGDDTGTPGDVLPESAQNFGHRCPVISVKRVMATVYPMRTRR